MQLVWQPDNSQEDGKPLSGALREIRADKRVPCIISFTFQVDDVEYKVQYDLTEKTITLNIPRDRWRCTEDEVDGADGRFLRLAFMTDAQQLCKMLDWQNPNDGTNRPQEPAEIQEQGSVIMTAYTLEVQQDKKANQEIPLVIQHNISGGLLEKLPRLHKKLQELWARPLKHSDGAFRDTASQYIHDNLPGTGDNGKRILLTTAHKFALIEKKLKTFPSRTSLSTQPALWQN